MQGRFWPIVAAMLLLSASATGSALAEQHLLPTPYPQQLGPNAQVIPSPEISHHQHLRPDPAPQAYGPSALGNPRPVRHHRHQHLIPDPYPRLAW